MKRKEQLRLLFAAPVAVVVWDVWMKMMTKWMWNDRIRWKMATKSIARGFWNDEQWNDRITMRKTGRMAMKKGDMMYERLSEWNRQRKRRHFHVNVDDLKCICVVVEREREKDAEKRVKLFCFISFCIRFFFPACRANAIEDEAHCIQIDREFNEKQLFERFERAFRFRAFLSFLLAPFADTLSSLFSSAYRRRTSHPTEEKKTNRKMKNEKTKPVEQQWQWKRMNWRDERITKEETKFQVHGQN